MQRRTIASRTTCQVIWRKQIASVAASYLQSHKSIRTTSSCQGSLWCQHAKCALCPRALLILLESSISNGEHTFKGILRFEPSDAGNFFFVTSDKETKNIGSYVGRDFRFSHEDTVKVTASLPQDAGAGCLEAPAELTLNQVSVVRDYGTDYDGTYIAEFRNARIGTFAPCKDGP